MKKYWLLVFLVLTIPAAGQVKSDESLFRQQLKSLQLLAKQKNFRQIKPIVHFPFYTSRADGNNGVTYPADPINGSEFIQYQSDIFNQEVRRLLPKLTEEALSEIDGNEDTYFAALRKATDRGSKMYEVYAEYALPGRSSESYFSFIFGRVKGRYQLLAYYAKWPVF